MSLGFRDIGVLKSFVSTPAFQRQEAKHKHLYTPTLKPAAAGSSLFFLEGNFRERVSIRVAPCRHLTWSIYLHKDYIRTSKMILQTDLMIILMH